MKSLMEHLYEIDDFLEELAEEVEPYLDRHHRFLQKIKSYDKPLSIFSMSSFHPKVESIRIGIFETAKVEEHYSVNILYRSLLEHFVKAQYLWMRTVEQESDEIGVDYWLFGNAQEAIDYGKNLRDAYSLVGIESEIDPIDVLRKKGFLDRKQSARGVKRKTDQFTYKFMTRHIAESLKAKESGKAPILQSIFPRYSELSSFVHGGPEATVGFDRANRDIKDAINMSTFASLYVRWSVYVLFYQYDEQFEPLLTISSKYLGKFSKFLD